jgi:hypothetical protein
MKKYNLFIVLIAVLLSTHTSYSMNMQEIRNIFAKYMYLQEQIENNLTQEVFEEIIKDDCMELVKQAMRQKYITEDDLKLAKEHNACCVAWLFIEQLIRQQSVPSVYVVRTAIENDYVDLVKQALKKGSHLTQEDFMVAKEHNARAVGRLIISYLGVFSAQSTLDRLAGLPVPQEIVHLIATFLVI